MAGKRGRPPRSVPDQLRTIVWYNAVSIHSGIKTAYGLEARFSPKSFKRRGSDAKVIRPNIWDRYRKGHRVPQDNLGTNSLITQVDKQFPGTAYYFRHPLWKLISKQNHSQYELVSHLRELKYVKQHTHNLIEAELSFGHVIPNYRACARIFDIGGLDALAIAILLFVIGWHIDALKVRREGFQLYSNLEIERTPELAPIANRLTDCIDNYIKEWEYSRRVNEFSAQIALLHERNTINLF